MSLGMVQEIVNDGNAACGDGGGLKAIEWAFETTPSSNLIANGPELSGGPNPDAIQVHNRMQSLANGAPKPFEFTSTDMALGPFTATYICTDGLEKESANYKFNP
jgi:hypothetical protein